jgi:hypothetical protein
VVARRSVNSVARRRPHAGSLAPRYGVRRYAPPALRPGLTRKRATETVWALLTWHPVARLVEECGWTQEHLIEWLEDLLSTLVG